jgi:hypothetical protein
MSLNGTSATPVTFTTDVNTTPDRKWYTLRLTYESTGDNDVNLRIESSAAATFTVDDVYVTEGGMWEQEGSRNFYGETRHVSLTHGASASFTFTGTGFSIGTELNRDGGEMEICYTNGTTVDECLVVPNEGNARDILRTVAGLPLGTYDVVIRDVEDGYTTTRRRDFEARSSRNAVGQLVIDFVQIYNNNTPPAIGDGVYDDTENELLYLPADRWLVETGSRARRAFNESYTTMAVDGREQRRMAGASIVMNIDIDDEDTPGPDYDGATLILYTTATSRSASTPVLVCAGAPDATISYEYDEANRRDVYKNDTVNSNCVVADNLDQTNVIPLEINSTDDTLVSITPLGDGEFKLDRYQVLIDSAITPGYYEDSVAATLVNVSGSWFTDYDRNYTGESAYMIESVGVETAQFDIVGATGISVVMPFDRDGGDFTINIVDTATSGTNYDEAFNFDTYSTSNLYRQALTVAGLPEDDYTVTVTKLATDDNLDGNIAGVFVIDAIEVYGELNELGSLYDDAVTNPDGTLVLTYGPSFNTWTAEAGSRARSYLNQTYHYTEAVGASVSFAVDGTTATGMMLYYGTSSTTTVEVCVTDINSVLDCNSYDLGDRVGQKSILWSEFTDLTGTAESVSIINTEQRRRLYLDAIQIMEGILAEGIYSAQNLVEDPYDAVQASFTDAELTDGEPITFDMTGIGFSAIFNESNTGNYDVCVTKTNPCDTVDTTNIPRPDSPRGEYALSVMGLHDGTSDGTYTVSITNNGSSVDVVELHILGALVTSPIEDDERINLDDLDNGSDEFNTLPYERIENDSPFVRYFPFGSYEEEEDRRGEYSGTPSTQHSTRMRGAGVYFEFTEADSFMLGLEQSSRNGRIEVCVGEIGTPIIPDDKEDSNCTLINTDQTNAKQSITVLDNSNIANLVNCDTAPGCWAFIRNDKTNSSESTFDFVSVFDSSEPLQAGWYENEFFDTDDIGSSAGEKVEDRRASAGFVREYNDSGDLTVV